MKGGQEMRKIEIDDVIRSFADRYSTLVQTECTDVKDKLKELGEFVAANNPWKDEGAVLDYIGLLIDDYTDLLILEPKEWEAYCNKYAAVLIREPGMLTTKVNYRSNKKGGFYRDKLYERILKCLQYETARLILGPIHQKMGLKTCVYCNVFPTMATDKDVMYQMDHFMPQSLYPFLGTCFYNLQPSCGICNGHKGKSLSDFGLYVNAEEDKELNPFLFLPKVNNQVKAYPICDEILFVGKDKNVTEESKAHEEMFHIYNMYAGYRGKVTKIYKNAYKMTDSSISAFSKAFDVAPTKRDVLAYLSDEVSLDERDIHNEPFTKLKQDTIKQLQEGGVI